MVGTRQRLVDAGFTVAAFDYPYREDGRKAPDGVGRLVACHRAVYEHLVATLGETPFLVGKSMGGRIGSHLAVASPGWVFLGYPLVPAGRTVVRDTSHLAAIGPMLFVSGSRDSLAPLPLLSRVVGGLSNAELEVIADADHGFRVPKRTGLSPAAVLDDVAGRAAAWMRARSALR